MLLLAIGYTMEKISNNSNILKDLKDVNGLLGRS